MRWQTALTWVRVRLTNIKELPEVVPEELTNKEMLELRHRYIAGEKTRKKGNCRRIKRVPRKISVKELAEALADLNKCLKSLTLQTPTLKGFRE